MSNPILVRPTWAKYEIIDWAHRYRAMKELGFTDVACIVIQSSDMDARVKTVAMNKFRGSVDELKMASLIEELKTKYMMTEFEIEEKLGLTEDEISDINDINEVIINTDDEVGIDEPNGVTIKLSLTDDELEMVYWMAETLWIDVKSLILRAVAESTRYINDGKEISKVVSVSDVEEFDISDIDF